jgi:hypothetical protein
VRLAGTVTVTNVVPPQATLLLAATPADAVLTAATVEDEAPLDATVATVEDEAPFDATAAAAVPRQVAGTLVPSSATAVKLEKP